MPLKFHDLRISYIVVFNLNLADNIKLDYQSLKNHKFMGKTPSYKLKSLSEDVYENDFIRMSPRLPTFKVELKLKEIDIFNIFHQEIEKIFIEEEMEEEIKFLSKIKKNIEKITITFTFDQCHICSAKFDFCFNLNFPMETPIIIRISKDLCIFIDDILFPKYLKKKIENILGISTDSMQLMNEHLTYPVISSTETNDLVKRFIRYELFGILWLEDSYKSFSKKIVDEVVQNDIALHKGDTLAIATIASLMIFKNTPLDGNYVNERINAIEIFCRQEYLLKKLDLKLDILIRKYNSNMINLKASLTEIRHTQTNIQSSLEFYRNTKISSTHSFDILFDTLNNVFKLDKYYKAVNEKLNACENLYRSLHEERRNQLAENIQLIIIFLGTFSLLIAILTLFKEFLAWTLICILIVILLIIQVKSPGKIKNIILRFVNFIIK